MRYIRDHTLNETRDNAEIGKNILITLMIKR
jgi:hypothetical protein